MVEVTFPRHEVFCAESHRHLWVYPTPDCLDLTKYPYSIHAVSPPRVLVELQEVQDTPSVDTSPSSTSSYPTQEVSQPPNPAQYVAPSPVRYRPFNTVNYNFTPVAPVPRPAEEPSRFRSAVDAVREFVVEKKYKCALLSLLMVGSYMYFLG